MEVIYPKACGIDVHKSFIVAVICDSTTVKPQYLRKRFSTFNNSCLSPAIVLIYTNLSP